MYLFTWVGLKFLVQNHLRTGVYILILEIEKIFQKANTSCCHEQQSPVVITLAVNNYFMVKHTNKQRHRKQRVCMQSG
jgi:hypothetical protein